MHQKRIDPVLRALRRKTGLPKTTLGPRLDLGFEILCARPRALSENYNELPTS